MDRGVPSEAILKDLRSPERQTFYLVGTPKSRINQHEKKWLDLPWQKVRDSVEVKLYEHEGELYVLAKSGGRQAKENAMRRKRLVRLLRKLRAMRKSLPKRDQLLLRIGAARKEAGRAFGFVKIVLPQTGEAVTRETFSFQTDKAKLKAAEQRDGHYLLRSIQMVEVWIPMLEGRWLMLPRYTQPEKDVQAMLNKLDITLPCQPPPRIKSSQPLPSSTKTAAEQPRFVVKT